MSALRHCFGPVCRGPQPPEAFRSARAKVCRACQAEARRIQAREEFRRNGRRRAPARRLRERRRYSEDALYRERKLARQRDYDRRRKLRRAA